MGHLAPREARRIAMRCELALLVLLLAWAPLGAANAEQVAFSGLLDIRTTVGTGIEPVQLLAVPVAGAAEVDGGVVRIPAGAFSAAVPNALGFDGTLVNGLASFSAGGAGAGSSCPLTRAQEICIAGGGFGGIMELGGVTQEGQALSVWGVGGSHVASTASGVVRTEEGTRWTVGNASAWYYVWEIDPGTPFLLSGIGSFRGLPSTFTGTGPAGFSVVTPMVVTSDLPTSSKNVRAVATLRIDFAAKPVPVGGAGVLALLLGILGATRLGLKRFAAA